VLSLLTGSVEHARRLYDLAAEYQNARRSEAPNAEELAARLDEAFGEAGGDIHKTLRQSQTYAFEKAAVAKATADRFVDQLKAYRAAPRIYLKEQRLAALEEALANARKYVVAAEEGESQVFILDLKDKLAPSLYELGGLEESGEK
jgi:hypothetical protein